MESKIELYQQRDFGQVISTTFDFIRQNFKHMFKGLLFICGPIVLLIVIFQSFYFTTNSLGYDWLNRTLELVQNTIISCVIYGYISLYEKKGPGNVSFQDIVDVVKKKWLSLIGTQFVVGFLIIIGILLLVIPGFYFAVVTSIVPVILLHEDKGVGQAISKAFDLIKDHWWETFGILVVLGIITIVVMVIMALPMTIISGISIAHSLSSTEYIENNSTFLTIVAALITVISTFCYIIIYTGIAVQYFSLTEEKFHIGAQQKIDELGNHSTTNAY